MRLGFLVAPNNCVNALIREIRAITWNAPALISGLVTGWIEDDTVAQLEKKRHSDGAHRQQLCRKLLWNTGIKAHRNAGFAWIPLEDGIRSEPIIRRLMELGYAVSGGEAFFISENIPKENIAKHDQEPTPRIFFCPQDHLKRLNSNWP